ncbi:MAG: hypothetical protein J1E41_07400, partial [Ruminococcus sp.]|nr:hypothetical protein [Ruminococcus sp.]
MSIVPFIILALLFNLLSGILFFKYIYDENKCGVGGLFLFVFIASLLVGFAITYKRHRTIWSVIAVGTIPYGIYCLIAYRGVGAIITSVLFVISLGFTAISIFTKIVPRKADRELVTMIRIKKLIHKTHSLAGYYSLVLVCIVVFSGANTSASVGRSSFPEDQAEINFSLEDWENADINQKEKF